MALLAAYRTDGNGTPLAAWLQDKVFASAKVQTVAPAQEDIDGFNRFFANYTKALAVERAAVENVD